MSAPVLSTHGLVAQYGDTRALFGVDLAAAAGEIVALVGANGAGKTTVLRAICGLLPTAPEQVRFQGEPVGGAPAHRLVGRGIAMVPEGRKLFPSLSIEENLRIGAWSGRPGHWTLARIFDLFPVLRERRHLPPGTLSGGQQQMVAIGRALMANPVLLLCDEISLGLAPVVIRDVYAALATVSAQGTTLLVVEQDVSLAQRVAGRLYCLRKGMVALAGASTALSRDDIRLAYFGM